MIEYRTGDIFDSGADYLVCPVNCVGVMGAGLAKQFKERFPDAESVYQGALREGKLTTREVYAILPPDEDEDPNIQGIIFFATKWHWKEPSELHWIMNGMQSLVNHLEFWHEDEGPVSVAVPKLGAGLGGLDWDDVKIVIERYARYAPENITFLIYE